MEKTRELLRAYYDHHNHHHHNQCHHHHQINVTIGLEKTRELRRAYYAAVSFVDSELGRVISEVAAMI